MTPPPVPSSGPAAGPNPAPNPAPPALTVLVVDDEPIARRRLIRLMRRIGGVVPVGEAGDVDQAVAEVARLRPDIVLLDILIPGGDGFAVLERLQSGYPGTATPQAIFVTAFDQHALRAFDAAAVDYITKPVDPARLALALSRAAGAIAARAQAGQIDRLTASLARLRAVQAIPADPSPNPAPAIWVKDRHGLRRIGLRDISHIRAERDYARLHLHNGTDCLHGESMAALEARLAPHGFLRVHRSLLVQGAAVAAVQRQRGGGLVLVLTDQTRLTAGRSYHAAIRQGLLAAFSGPGAADGI